ncbi:MAG: fatty acid desaturase [Parvularculaceae bacterium]
MQCMREPVYYQFWLFAVPLAVAALASWAYLAGHAPAALTAVVNGVCQFFAFTVAHDSAHSVYCRESRVLKRLNLILARIVSLLYLIPFSSFKFAHLGHHHHFNDATRDPDHWVAGRNVFLVAAKCATMHAPYYGIILRKAPLRVRSALVLWIVCLVGLVAASIVYVFFVELAVMWLIPAHIAIFLVAFVFDWAAHHPHHEKMFGDSPAYLLPEAIRPFASFCVANQTFHLIHHLYPRVPWTRVERLYWEIEPWLAKEGVRVVDWRGR